MPSAENAIALTEPPGSSYRYNLFLVLRSHIRTLPIGSPEANRLPSGVTAKALTIASCFRVAISVPVCRVPQLYVT